MLLFRRGFLPGCIEKTLEFAAQIVEMAIAFSKLLIHGLFAAQQLLLQCNMGTFVKGIKP